jgi:hypothetical protein
MMGEIKRPVSLGGKVRSDSTHVAEQGLCRIPDRPPLAGRVSLAPIRAFRRFRRRPVPAYEFLDVSRIHGPILRHSYEVMSQES